MSQVLKARKSFFFLIVSLVLSDWCQQIDGLMANTLVEPEFYQVTLCSSELKVLYLPFTLIIFLQLRRFKVKKKSSRMDTKSGMESITLTGLISRDVIKFTVFIKMWTT